MKHISPLATMLALAGGGTSGSPILNIFLIAAILIGVFVSKPWVNGSLLTLLLVLIGSTWMTKVAVS